MNCFVFVLVFLFFEFISSFFKKYFLKTGISYQEYFLAGRSVRFWPLTFSFVGAHVGSGLVLGVPQFSHCYGWQVFLFPLSICLGFWILSRTLLFRFSLRGVKTNAEILGKVYQSEGIKKVASFISIISLFFVLLAQMIGSRLLFSSLGINSPSLFVAFWSCVILYTMQGGFRSVISADLLQMFFIFVAFILVYCFSFNSYSEVPDFFSFPNSPVNLGLLLRWLSVPMVFLWVDQDMEQRCLSGRFRSVSQSLKVAALIILFVGYIAVYFGVLAQHHLVCLGKDCVMMQFSKLYLGFPLNMILLSAIFLAISSASTSVVHAMGSNLSNDFSFSLLNRKETIAIAQGVSCTISLFAVLLAWSSDSILDVLLFGYGLSVSCLFVPLVMAVKRKKENPILGWISIIIGGVSFLCLQPISSYFPIEIGCVVLSFLGFFSGEKFLRKIPYFLNTNIN